MHELAKLPLSLPALLQNSPKNNRWAMDEYRKEVSFKDYKQHQLIELAKINKIERFAWKELDSCPINEEILTQTQEMSTNYATS